MLCTAPKLPFPLESSSYLHPLSLSLWRTAKSCRQLPRGATLGCGDGLFPPPVAHFSRAGLVLLERPIRVHFGYIVASWQHASHRERRPWQRAGQSAAPKDPSPNYFVGGVTSTEWYGVAVHLNIHLSPLPSMSSLLGLIVSHDAASSRPSPWPESATKAKGYLMLLGNQHWVGHVGHVGESIPRYPFRGDST